MAGKIPRSRSPRDRKITQGWLDILRKRKEFRSLPEQWQHELAHMIWTDFMRVKEHEAVEGATSYTYQELDWRFGEGKFIKEVNARTDAFLVGPWSKDGGLTRSFILSPMYKTMKRTYLKRAMDKPDVVGDFLDMNGTPIRSAPKKAISGKLADGTTSPRLWGEVELNPVVPINIAQLEALYKKTWADIKSIRSEQLQHRDLFKQDVEINVEKLERRAEWAATLIILANATFGGRGWLHMRYRESDSGRLYGLDENLQNCPSEVRMHALDGFYDYDISNCHYTLLAQMASRYDIPSPKIQSYIDNKGAVRQGLADQLQVDKQKIKDCLIGLIYGAKLSAHKIPGKGKDSAIYKALGAEKGAELLKTPLFAELASEVKQVGLALLAKWPVRSGSLVNDAGWGVRRTEHNRKKLAHLLQGAEALILKTAVEYVEARKPENIILLQHDGFTAKEEVDREDLSAHIERETGYRVVWERDRIQPKPDADISKLQ